MGEVRVFGKDTTQRYTVLADKQECSVMFSVYVGSDEDADHEPLLIGYIKWDGCSNWNFSKENYPLHCCGRDNAEDFANLFLEMYDWALEWMPENKEYLMSDKKANEIRMEEFRMKSQKPNLTKLEQEQQYVAFLKKRLESENYKNNVSAEEYALTKAKYEKAKFKLKMLVETTK